MNGEKGGEILATTELSFVGLESKFSFPNTGQACSQSIYRITEMQRMEFPFKKVSREWRTVSSALWAYVSWE